MQLNCCRERVPLREGSSKARIFDLICGCPTRGMYCPGIGPENYSFKRRNCRSAGEGQVLTNINDICGGVVQIFKTHSVNCGGIWELGR